MMSEQSNQTERKRQVTVLCLTYGEPPENRFLPQFAYSLSILNRLTRRVTRIPTTLMPLMAAWRARDRVRRFRGLGWHSPLEDCSRRQTESLRRILPELYPGIDWQIELVFEFRHPYIWEFLEPMTAHPPDEIVMLPLYVADSDFTSGVSRTDLENFHRRCVRRPGGNPLPVPRYTTGFGFDPACGRIVADFILRKIRESGWTDEKLRSSVLILGAHGTVIRPPFGINSGARETRYLYGLIRSHLKPLFRSVRIGWLNHKVGGPWTFPEVTESAGESYDSGIRNVVYFTFGFVADNGETQLEGKVHLEPYDWDDVLYLPCENDDPEFMRLMARRVVGTLDQEAGSWEEIGQGDPALARQEKPPRRGVPGAGRLTGPMLAALAALLWAILAIVFLSGAGMLLGHVSSGDVKTAIILFGLLAGSWIGWDFARPMSRGNLLRVRRLPQPSPWRQALARPSWIMIALIALLGAAAILLPVPAGTGPAAILLVLGIVCAWSVVGYLVDFHLARPVAERS